jgi:hypothetical protein
MKTVQLVIPDLLLPKQLATELGKGLSLPALERMLGRGQDEMHEHVSLEEILCGFFDITTADDVPIGDDAPIAPVSAAFDGLAAGCWLRADPVNLTLQRDRMLLSGLAVGEDEAAVLCASLNEYYAGQGLEFFAPHPQRWYVRLDTLPRIRTTPLSEVIGGEVRRVLPTGEDAARWHQLFNEIQMLLFSHPLNKARETRGEPMINSLWLWGAGGPPGTLRKSFDRASSDDVLVEMFSAAAALPFVPWQEQWVMEDEQRQLLVWTGLRTALQRGDLAGWCTALQAFENGYARPLWQALRTGKLTELRLDITGADSWRRVRLTPRDTWTFWRRNKRLADYSPV